MSYALGTATGRIEIEYDGTGTREAAQDIDGLKGNSEKALKGLNTLGNTAGAAGALIAGGFAVGVNAAANFEERVSAISAVSGATGSELDGLRQKALDLGKDTKYSATEAASAIEELVKSGLSVDEVLNGAADATVALAAAGEVDLPQAAMIASNAMNQFNLSAEDMVNVSDKIAGAANSSAIDVSDFGQSMQQVGAVANLAGLSFDDTTTAIALMGNAGIKGSDAGTSLKSMLMRLQPTTKKQALEMERLGLITEKGGNQFYDAKGNLKSFSDISGTLKNSLKGMTKEQKQAALQTLFGSDAIRAAAIMANNGSKGFDKMSASIGKTKAADVAKTRMDNFKGSLEQMKGSLETAGIAVGTVLLPPLRTLVDAVADAANWFLSLSDSQQKMIITAIGVVGALLLIFAGIAKMIVFANNLRTAYVALRAVAIPTWLATLGPILLVIAAIALVVVVIVLLWKKSETFRKIVIGAWNAVKNATITAFNAVVNAIRAAWAWVTSNTKAAGTSVRNAVVNAWNAVKGAVSSAVSAVRNAVTNAWNNVRTATVNAWNRVKEAVSTAIDNVVSTAKGIKDRVLGAIGDAGSWLFDKGKEIIQGLIDGIGAMVGKVTDAIHKVTSIISNALPGSPVKEGPLKVLNRGYAGKQIVQMIIDGVETRTAPLRNTVDSALTVAPDVDLRRLAGIAPTSGRSPAAPAAGGFPSGMTISGTLSIDEDGVAFITGIAEDVYDDFNDDNNRRNH
jgi:TP901 family phage tail tape measure protein